MSGIFYNCCDKGHDIHKVVWGPKGKLLIQAGTGSGVKLKDRKVSPKEVMPEESKRGHSRRGEDSAIPRRENPLDTCMMG